MMTVLFDLDGTLTDSGEGIINCAKLALSHFGLPIPSDEAMREFVGPPLEITFPKFGVPEDRVQEAIEVFRSRYQPIGMYENRVYSGIPEMLGQLRQEGQKLCVATSKPEQTAKKVLAYFSLTDYFDCICGATMDSARVSKQDVIAYLLAQEPPEGTIVMVGDTPYDVRGAAVFQIPTIGVSWGYSTEQELNRAGAAAIAHTPDEIPSLLLTLPRHTGTPPSAQKSD